MTKDNGTASYFSDWIIPSSSEAERYRLHK